MAVLNVFTLLVASGVILVRPTRVLAQEAQPPSLSAAELDDVVARVALYSDSLLAQVLAASSFAEQIPDAYKWANSHKNLKGDALVDAMEKGQLPFDPSVQALIPFPTVLELMNQDIAWTQKLGDAVLVQRGDVMDAVQRMRKKAQDAGNLKSTEQIKVVQSSPQVIEIQTPSPQVVYVPTYNPQVVYVPAPPSNTGAVIAASLIAFTAGVAITAAFSDGWWGHQCGFGWSSHTVIVHNSAWGRTWVNHRTYAHTWGGYNRGFYSRPYAYANTNVYARRNVNVNVNNNVNVNRNVNVNQNTNINRNVNQNVNRNANLNQNVDRNANVNQARAQNYNRGTDHVGATNRGYTQESHSGGTFSGANNGRADHAAANRGRASRHR